MTRVSRRWSNGPGAVAHGPCAVIAEPRRLASKPFDQNPVQALASGAISGGHRGPFPVLLQLATETAARASEPWCVRHRTRKVGAFSHGFWQTGCFWVAPTL